MKKTASAFSLIELLIVVAILGILATIAVPQFNNAMTRAKVSKARGDMHALEQALFAFANDNHDMFPMIRYDFYEGASRGEALGRLARLAPLTSPVSYINGIPHDPFMKGGVSVDPESMPPNDVYLYWDEETTKKFRDANAFLNAQILLKQFGNHKHKRKTEGIVLMSAGPDRQFAVDDTKLPPKATSPNAVPGPPYACASSYDPSNGVASLGEIYHPFAIGKEK